MGTEGQPVWRRAATHSLHAALVLKATVEERLQERLGLLLADNEALVNLRHAGLPLRMSDIADRLILSRGGATKVIDRLEAMGLVARRPDPADGRATVVEITPEGTAMAVAAKEIVDECLEQAWSAHITDEEARVILDVMDRVLAHHRPHSS